MQKQASMLVLELALETSLLAVLFVMNNGRKRQAKLYATSP